MTGNPATVLLFAACLSLLFVAGARLWDVFQAGRLRDALNAQAAQESARALDAQDVDPTMFDRHAARAWAFTEAADMVRGR